MSGRPALISVDWGTSSLRAYLVGIEGDVRARMESSDGILAVAAGTFEQILETRIAPWTADHGRLPVLMSGMIGSRQGWVEAPYARCPAGLSDIAARLVHIPSTTGRAISLIPGLDVEDAAGVPDVMRGEETQILGAYALMGRRDGRLVLPGTHSKWARVEAGAIVGFRTYMTGEIFAALKDHTILGRTMSGGSGSGAGFLAGLAATQRGQSRASLLTRLFSVRTLALFGKLGPAEAADYLSGLLIGEELLDASQGMAQAEPMTVIASAALTARYSAAGRALGLDLEPAPADCVVAGQLALARAAGLIAPQA